MGLKPEHHGELNCLRLPKEEERRRYVELRKLYANDQVALQQIDVYDDESPYFQHIIVFRDAFRRGDNEAETREESWLRDHYPDIK